VSLKQASPEFYVPDRIEIAKIMQAHCKTFRMVNVEKRNFTLQTPF
jgi:hypothetical protein